MAERHHFFINPENINNQRFTLTGNEGHHLSRVSRVKSGDEITLLDGTGCAYNAMVTDVDKDHVAGILKERKENYNEPEIRYHLGIGILKGAKLDWVVEKCTELGVASITPLNMKNNVKRGVNLERLQKIVKSAVKQCGRGNIPVITPLTDFSSWIKSANDGNRAVAEIGWDAMPLLKWISNLSKDSNDVWITIGPEGGFHKSEFDLINEVNIPLVSLGQRRLRSETAAVATLAILDSYFNTRS